MKLLSIEGVTGVSFSESRPGGVVKIYLREDRPEYRERIPAHIEGIPTEIEISGELMAQGD